MQPKNPTKPNHNRFVIETEAFKNATTSEKIGIVTVYSVIGLGALINFPITLPVLVYKTPAIYRSIKEYTTYKKECEKYNNSLKNGSKALTLLSVAAAKPQEHGLDPGSPVTKVFQNKYLVNKISFFVFNDTETESKENETESKTNTTHSPSL